MWLGEQVRFEVEEKMTTNNPGRWFKTGDKIVIGEQCRSFHVRVMSHYNEMISSLFGRKCCLTSSKCEEKSRNSKYTRLDAHAYRQIVRAETKLLY